MTHIHRKLVLSASRTRSIFGALALGAALCAGPAFANEEDAANAITKAETKIETVTRVAGEAGDIGDQSFSMARERLDSAKAAKKDNKYDKAEMLANESSVLADLTAERAKLAALKVSHENLIRTSSAATAAVATTVQ